jgi:hypothetical protein
MDVKMIKRRTCIYRGRTYEFWPSATYIVTRKKMPPERSFVVEYHNVERQTKIKDWKKHL